MLGNMKKQFQTRREGRPLLSKFPDLVNRTMFSDDADASDSQRMKMLRKITPLDKRTPEDNEQNNVK